MRKIQLCLLLLIFTSILFANNLANFNKLSEQDANYQMIKEKLDTFIPYSQEGSLGNSRNGNLLSESIREVNYDDTWFTSKETYEYNELNQMTDLYRHVRPETEWLYDSHITFSYVEGTDLISEGTVYDYEDAEWENDGKVTYEYDDNGLLIKLTSYDANYYNGNWEIEWKVDYNYENSNCVEEIISIYSNMGTGFYPTNICYKDYNETNQLVQEINVTIEDDEEINQIKEIFSYTDGLLTESIDFSWDGTNWMNNCQNIRNYNDDVLITNSSYYYWSGSEWHFPYVKEYTYDDNGVLIQKKYYTQQDDVVINYSLFDYAYDEDGDLIFQNEDQWEEDQWVPFENYTNAYIPATTNAEDVTAPEFALSNFPNPFNPITTISFAAISNSQNADLVIYNVKGQEIKNFGNLHNQNSVVWKGKDNEGNPVGSGIYFYQLNVDGEQRAIRKCLLLK